MRFKLLGRRRRKKSFFADLRERRALRKSLPTVGVLNQRAEWPGHFPQVYVGVLGGFGVGHAVWAGRTYRVVTMFGRSRVELLPPPPTKAQEARRAFRHESPLQRYLRQQKFERQVRDRGETGWQRFLREAKAGRNLTRDKFKKAGAAGGGERGIGIGVRAENRKRKPLGRRGGGPL